MEDAVADSVAVVLFADVCCDCEVVCVALLSEVVVDEVVVSVACLLLGVFMASSMALEPD